MVGDVAETDGWKAPEEAEALPESVFPPSVSLHTNARLIPMPERSYYSGSMHHLPLVQSVVRLSSYPQTRPVYVEIHASHGALKSQSGMWITSSSHVHIIATLDAVAEDAVHQMGLALVVMVDCINVKHKLQALRRNAGQVCVSKL